MNDCVTDVFERINTLQSDHEELEVRVNGLTAREKNLQAMEEQVAAITRRPYLLDTPPPSRLVNPDDSTLAFHITGIRNLQNGGQYDPVEVIKGLLYTVASNSSTPGSSWLTFNLESPESMPGLPLSTSPPTTTKTTLWSKSKHTWQVKGSGMWLSTTASPRTRWKRSSC